MPRSSGSLTIAIKAKDILCTIAILSFYIQQTLSQQKLYALLRPITIYNLRILTKVSLPMSISEVSHVVTTDCREIKGLEMGCLPMA